jgi:hypothetical protein
VSTALATVDAIAGRLTDPRNWLRDAWWNQSLAKGALGIALLHVERAHTETDGLKTAHAWLSAATRGNLSAGANASLFFGAPAAAFALQAAPDKGRFGRALAALDTSIADMTRRRLAAAQARLDRAERPRFAEWDLIYGLTGLGVYLLRRDRYGDVFREVLSYLVRLSEPGHVNGAEIPGWWTHTDPSGGVSSGFPGGHGNLGMAHGISGPLALLSLAMRRGIVVDGHADAIARICQWLDSWRQDHNTGTWWPQWITLQELRTGQVKQASPLRPSWCYGTPGMARAQQLAGLAVGNHARQRLAAQATVDCLSDADQLRQIRDNSLCHGWAGLFQTCWRIARDAESPALTAHVTEIANRFRERTDTRADRDIGLLEGISGVALALHTAVRDAQPASDWDTCLLIS